MSGCIRCHPNNSENGQSKRPPEEKRKQHPKEKEKEEEAALKDAAPDTDPVDPPTAQAVVDRVRTLSTQTLLVEAHITSRGASLGVTRTVTSEEVSEVQSPIPYKG